MGGNESSQTSSRNMKQLNHTPVTSIGTPVLASAKWKDEQKGNITMTVPPRARLDSLAPTPSIWWACTTDMGTGKASKGRQAVKVRQGEDMPVAEALKYGFPRPFREVNS